MAKKKRLAVLQLRYTVKNGIWIWGSSFNDPKYKRKGNNKKKEAK